MKKTTLLIVEDEVAIRDMLRFSLPTEEFNVLDAENTQQASQLLADYIADLIVLDWMLPGKSGIDFIKWLKQQELLKHIPIIMLTARAEEDNKVRGLMAGADDYITKPFSVNELIARIKTVLRRGAVTVSPDNEIRAGKLVLNTAKHQVSIEDQPIELTPLEYKICHFLMTHPDKVYSRDQLISHVWGGNIYIDDRTVDVHVKRMRAKLQPYKQQHLIKTVRGVGYIFGVSHEKTP